MEQRPVALEFLLIAQLGKAALVRRLLPRHVSRRRLAAVAPVVCHARGGLFGPQDSVGPREVELGEVW